MARTQRNFVKGRMNKVLDERLVPNGEYIDALNVRLGSTEESEIGSIEKAKGNTQLTRLFYLDPVSNTNVNLSNSARCIGAYDDGANETIYWFVHDPSFSLGNTGKLDMIVSFNTLTTDIVYHVVSIDDGSGVNTTLNFNPKFLVTGVNLEGDLLFFTDNFNPPRVINTKKPFAEPNTATSTTSSTTAWSFTAGQTTGTGAEQIGFHQGTTLGCPTSINEMGVGVAPTTTQINLPGTGCYTLGTSTGFKTTKGFGIQGANNASGFALTQFMTTTSGSSAGSSTLSIIMASGAGNPGQGVLSGTITGSDGSSGTFSCNYDMPQYFFTDDNGAAQNPEATGSLVLTGLSLTNGVTYTLTL